MKWHGAWLYGVHRTRRDGSSFMWRQACQRCKYTTSVDIQKTHYKKLFTYVESHASAVSLLESGEQRYIQAINNNITVRNKGQRLTWLASVPRFCADMQVAICKLDTLDHKTCCSASALYSNATSLCQGTATRDGQHTRDMHNGSEQLTVHKKTPVSCVSTVGVNKSYRSGY